ncbi:MAG: cation transporting ATPase C-terminal domain-containing protein, partial [Peptostreptococcaceae bacterium]|nr:cation transporting ATPase C-terminal domain-containing protein [Peptostreptococcaceae bacterium]
NILGATEAQKGTVVFSVFAFSVLFNALKCREFGIRSALTNFFKNKLALKVIGLTATLQVLFTQVFNSFFNSVPLSIIMWVKIILLSSTILIINEVVKYVLRTMRSEVRRYR